MSIPLVVSNYVYNYPSPSDNPPWGSDATAWAQAVTLALNSVIGAGDILPTTSGLLNNQTSVTNIQGLSFDPTITRGAIIEYSIYRVTTGVGAQELAEVGSIELVYKSTAATWEFNQVHVGEAFVTFSITPLGQFQYVTNNMTGTGYTAKLSFRARAFPV